MVLPIPNLDDRRFDDLVKEGRERVSKHLPELTRIAPGDPVNVMVDLFAYLTETMLYRMNLIPERQRRAVLNLLQIPVRNARPSLGVICIDAGQAAVNLPPLVRDGTQLKAGAQAFTGSGELQPTPLGLTLLIKRALSDEELAATGISLQELRDQYGIRRGDRPRPFEPRSFTLGKDVLSLEQSLDDYFYLALTLPKRLVNQREQLVENLAGITLNIAIAPADDLDGEEISSLAPRQLNWELLTRDEESRVLALPLEIVSDNSRGGRQTGVVRLRLPDNPQLYDSLEAADPMFAGVGSEPPELPAPLTGERVAFWLRLSSRDEPRLNLGYLGVNGLGIVGQGLKQDRIIGIGNGNPDQHIKLDDSNIAADSMVLQVEESHSWVTWQQVEFLVGHGGDANVYRLDPMAGVIYFGDGLEGGRRPPEGRRIRILRYRYGGGSNTNVEAGEIREIVAGSNRLNLRHEWPTRGGVDAESVSQAERRIPQFLSHRNRAVTAQDFRILAENNPVNPVARAHVMPGFLPGNHINAVRENVKGVVSVFVLPPRRPALRQTPRPSRGLLKDVFEYLLQRVLIGTELYVLSPEFVPLAVGIKVDVVDPETEQQVLQAVQVAMVDYLWPLPPGGARGDGWGMGATVRASELATRAGRVDGVRSVNSLNLFARDAEGQWRRLSEEQAFGLSRYQLPELLGVDVSTGSGEPAFPGGIESADDAGRGVPAPVIPDVC